MIEIVPPALAGERIDRIVAMLTGCSRAEAASLIERGAVRLGSAPAKGRAERVAEGDEVEITEEPAKASATPEPDPSVVVPIVHLDDALIVVDKPPGLVVHPGAGNRMGTLVSGLLARFPEMADVGDPERPGIVHRLDKDTSGLMLVARTQAAAEALVDQLKARAVTRRYLALVWGRVENTQGLIDAPIGRSTRSPTKMSVTTAGREARTRYEVLRAFDDPVIATLVRCELETGRTHQIRVHLAAIHHPVVGDDRYRGVRESLESPRVWLHAAQLAFDHPVTGERLTFDSALPADLQSVLDRLS